MSTFVSAYPALVLTYLLNALWQAPLLFGVAWLTALLLRRLGPQAEHRLWVGTLLAQVALPALAVPSLTTALQHMFAARGNSVGTVSVTLGSVQPLSGSNPWLSWRAALPVYVAIVVFCACRFAWQSLRLRGLLVRTRSLGLPPEFATFFRACRAELGVGKVKVRCGVDVKTPFTFGLRRPVLLLPGRFLEETSAIQLRAALAHELVHVARRDAAKQMLYRLLALPLCMHPAVVLTLQRLAGSREEVCDTRAAVLTGGTRSYANSLLELAALLAVPRPAHYPAVGIFDANRLERRILMLRHPIPVASRTRRTLTLAATGLLAAVACTSALALHQQVEPAASEASAPTAAAQDGRTIKVPSGLMAGQVDHRVQPKYPAEAKKQRVSGSVVLHAVIGKTGAVESLQVISGPDLLRASAIDAVRQWTYKPYLLNGDPTAVDTTITINYSFSDDEGPAPGAASTLLPDGVLPPKLLHQVDAEYPAAAKRAKVSGEVLVAMLVKPDGHVSDVDAVSGPPELRAAAVDAVKQYVFAPATLHGEAVPANLRIQVNFQTF